MHTLTNEQLNAIAAGKRGIEGTQQAEIVTRLLVAEAQTAEYLDRILALEAQLAELGNQSPVAEICDTDELRYVGSDPLSQFPVKVGDKLYARPVPQAVSQPYTMPDEAPHGYFAFWPEHGEAFFNKREDAVAFCKEAIEDYRRKNADEGFDERDVTRTCWGIIMQKGAANEVDDEGHIDYALTD